MNDIKLINNQFVLPDYFLYIISKYKYYFVENSDQFTIIRLKKDYGWHCNEYNKLIYPCDFKIPIKKGNKYSYADNINLNYNAFYTNSGDFIIYINTNFLKKIQNIDTFSIFNNLIKEYVNAYLRSSDEIYYPYVIDNDLTVSYLTESKYIEYVYNNSRHLEKYSRKMPLSKILIGYCSMTSNEVSILMEKIKIINNYNSENFEIVTGENIIKYYDSINYCSTNGSLGGSCMRAKDHRNKLIFYSKNSNISLIVLKVKGNILGRALLWTTITGDKIMDRIYVNDDKLVSHFHKFAKEHNILNIYDYKEKGNSDTTIFKMAPGHWIHNFSINFIVDLEYLPLLDFDEDGIDLFSISKDSPFLLEESLRKRQTTLCDTLPYLDNFCFINYFKKQISNLPLKDFYKCPLSKQYINRSNDIISINNKAYHIDYVTNVDGKAVLLTNLIKHGNSEPQTTVINNSQISELLDLPY